MVSHGVSPVFQVVGVVQELLVPVEEYPAGLGLAPDEGHVVPQAPVPEVEQVGVVVRVVPVDPPSPLDVVVDPVEDVAPRTAPKLPLQAVLSHARHASDQLVVVGDLVRVGVGHGEGGRCRE